MSRSVRRSALLAALALALGACASAVPPMGDPPPRLTDARAERSYQELLARRSARADSYAGFDTRLFASATLQTPDFREARVRRMAAFKKLTVEETEALLAQERAEAELGPEFFLGVHVNDMRFDTLDRKDGIWRVALVTPAGEALAAKVERIGRSNLDLRAFYPYLGTFWTAYRVRFAPGALPADAERAVLRVSSTVARVDLDVAAR